MPRSRLGRAREGARARFRPARGGEPPRRLAGRLAGRLAWLSLVASLLSGCGRRSCSETEAELEPLAGALEDRLRAGVSTLYYAGGEYRGRAVRVEGFAAGGRPSSSYSDEHWRGNSPRLLIRASAEPSGETLSLAAPGWDLDELQDLEGQRVLLVIYVPKGYAPPPPGHSAELGRVVYLCE